MQSDAAEVVNPVWALVFESAWLSMILLGLCQNGYSGDFRQMSRTTVLLSGPDTDIIVLCLQAQSILGELIFSVSNSSELLSSLQYRGMNVTDTQLLFSDVGSGASYSTSHITV